MNKFEFRIFALRRSGHHAVMNWILSAFQDKCLYNDCSVVNGKPEWNLNGSYGNKTENNGCYMYNFEHFDFKSDMSLCNYFRSTSLNFCNVVILRDVYNWSASILKHNKSDAPCDVNLWNQYADMFLRDHQINEHKTVYINFNDWYRNKTMRRAYAVNLAIEPKESSLLKIGALSSFDTGKFDGKANQMKVLTRYKHYENDRKFKKLFNRKCANYNDRIFGFTL